MKTMELREWFFKKTKIWSLWDILPYRYCMYYYDCIKPIFSPKHKRIRNAIPRNWCDITSLIETVNFEFVKSFYEDEYKQSCVDWKATEHHKEFEEWLIKAYRYITVERPILEKRLGEAYPPARPISEMFKPITDEKGRKMFEMVDDGVPYEVKYKKVNELKAKIEKKDTKVLIEIIKRRDDFWT